MTVLAIDATDRQARYRLIGNAAGDASPKAMLVLGVLMMVVAVVALYVLFDDHAGHQPIGTAIYTWFFNQLLIAPFVVLLVAIVLGGLLLAADSLARIVRPPVRIYSCDAGGLYAQKRLVLGRGTALDYWPFERILRIYRVTSGVRAEIWEPHGVNTTITIALELTEADAERLCQGLNADLATAAEDWQAAGLVVHRR